MEIVTWNVKFRRPHVIDALARTCKPDILTLQEVTLAAAPAYRERLAAMGLPHMHYSGRPRVSKKRYGNLIASRWPLKPVSLRGREDAPWPQLLAAVTVSIKDHEVAVITAHIPNGSGNGWGRSIRSRPSPRWCGR